MLFAADIGISLLIERASFGTAEYRSDKLWYFFSTHLLFEIPCSIFDIQILRVVNPASRGN